MSPTWEWNVAPNVKKLVSLHLFVLGVAAVVVKRMYLHLFQSIKEVEHGSHDLEAILKHRNQSGKNT